MDLYPSTTPAALRRTVLAAALAACAAFAGCDRKPTSPPKPSTALSSPQGAGHAAVRARPSLSGVSRAAAP